MKKSRKKILISSFVFLIFFFLTTYISFKPLPSDLPKEDIYFSWLEGDRIANGENPYSRIHDGDMKNNNKYATYFPLFYELSYLTNIAGMSEYPDWIGFWRIIFFIFNFGISLLIFYPFYKKNMYLMGLFGSAFWLFNRWTLHVVKIMHIEFLAVFFFVLSIIIFHKNHKAGALSYGLSLAVKQIGIFAAPLFLIWAWQSESKKPVRKTLETVFYSGIIPFISSLPFLFWDLSGFFKSIFFSATRAQASHSRAYSLDTHIDLVGLPAKIPLLLFLIVVFSFAWRKKIGKYMAAFLTMLMFVEFNSVLFVQYMVWIMALIPLVLFEYIDSKHDNDNKENTPSNLSQPSQPA